MEQKEFFKTRRDRDNTDPWRIDPHSPLADKVRPRNMDEFVGQTHILGEGTLLRAAIEKDQVPSLILWGPPGSGKTTLAAIIAHTTGSIFVRFSAVTSGIKELRLEIAHAKEAREKNKKTVLFVDEIHRWNKAQQDAFLPHVEDGTVILIGATTENPSFEVISALLSRCRVFTLKPLEEDHIAKILRNALQDEERGLGQHSIDVGDEGLLFLAKSSGGDARVALNAMELAFQIQREHSGDDASVTLTEDVFSEALQKRSLLYDKAGEEHFNLISALHKSLRGSDPDAALYWIARMMEAGEHPMYLARRMVRFASEDIGNADPQALVISLAAQQAYHFLGSPEGDLALAQAAVYLATCPKSNAIYVAYDKALEDVRQHGTLPSPLHIRNAPTKLMEEMEYGKGYKYAHEYEDAYVAQEYLPDELQGQQYYDPPERGFEREIRRRLEFWRNKKNAYLADKRPDDNSSDSEEP